MLCFNNYSYLFRSYESQTVAISIARVHSERTLVVYSASASHMVTQTTRLQCPLLENRRNGALRIWILFWMRNRRQVAAGHFAPTADKSSAEFQKKNASVVFVVLFNAHDFALILIDLNNGARPDYWRHALIVYATN